MRGKVAVGPIVNVGGLVDEGEGPHQDGKDAETDVGNTPVGIQAALAAAPAGFENVESCMDGDERDGEIRGLDTEAEEEAADLAKR